MSRVAIRYRRRSSDAHAQIARESGHGLPCFIDGDVVKPGSIQVPLTMDQTVPSTDELGPCYACQRPLLKYQSRWAGEPGLLLHWECAEAIWPSLGNAGEATLVKPLLTAEQLAYKAGLRSIRTTTLYSMICTYEDNPGERTAQIDWMIDLVRAEYATRPGAL